MFLPQRNKDAKKNFVPSRLCGVFNSRTALSLVTKKLLRSRLRANQFLNLLIPSLISGTLKFIRYPSFKFVNFRWLITCASQTGLTRSIAFNSAITSPLTISSSNGDNFRNVIGNFFCHKGTKAQRKTLRRLASLCLFDS